MSALFSGGDSPRCTGDDDDDDDPRYIVDLIAKVTTVAVETMKIVDGLAEDAE